MLCVPHYGLQSISFSFLRYPWYWLMNHKTLLVYVLLYVLYVYVDLAHFFNVSVNPSYKIKLQL